MWQWLRFILRHQLVSNALSLYGMQVARYLLPLVTIPYLARVLGPSDWGLVALTLSYGVYLGLPISYGFDYSGTREIAQVKHDKNRVAEVFAGVLGARSLAVVVCVLLSWGVEHWVRVFREHPGLLWAGVFASIAMNLAPNWYFQGLERMRLLATLDISGRVVATAGIFLFIHSPADDWKVLLLWGVGGAVGLTAGMILAYEEIDFLLPTWSLISDVLRKGWAMFVTRGATSLYTAGNSFILGLFAPTWSVGYYAGAEKIARAAVTSVLPLGQTLFPRVSGLIHTSRPKAIRLARIAAIAFGVIGISGGLAIFLLAPWLVRIILGPAFMPAVPVLRILSLLIPLFAVGTVLGTVWMLPQGLDGPVTVFVGGGAIVNIGLGILIAPRLFHTGMALVAVAAELFVAAGFFSYLSIRKMGFWNLPAESLLVQKTTGK